MIKKLKLFILSVSSLIMFMVPMAVSTTAFADVSQSTINGGLNCGANGDLTKGDCGSDSSSAGKVNTLVTTVVNVISIIVGIIAVIMIIVAGLRYVTSGGKQESVTGAKNTILYAVIGLVIVALAQLIVHFILNKTSTATGTS